MSTATNTTPPPPAPVSTFAGVSYDVGALSQSEAAFIDFARKVKASNDIDLCTLDAKSLRMLARFQNWRRQGDTWLGMVMCDEGVIRFWNGKPDGRIG